MVEANRRQPRKFVAGNWKMHGVGASIGEAVAVARSLAEEPTDVRVAIFPPATLIHRMAQALDGTAVEVGGQDAHAHAWGAYTGDICTEMLKDAGAELVILGHSERRITYGETNEVVAAKADQARKAGLEPIICVGESRSQREQGRAIEVVRAQVKESVPMSIAGKAFSVAYEPIWAIGSGLTPTVPQIEEVHASIRKVLIERFGPAGASVAILYGGSVKPDNAAEILQAKEVGGALVGGASLNAEDFLAIIRAAG